MLILNNPSSGSQVEQSFKLASGTSVPYLLYLPKKFDAKSTEKWPVILFLHGRGESRGPLSIVAKWGPPRMAARGDNLPYIIISPQCPADQRWTSAGQLQAVLDLLAHISKSFPVDSQRIYLTGLSMGGYGSWKLAAEHGKLFAAVAPICGAGDPKDAMKLKSVPVWAFHGTEDRAVPYQRSLEIVEAIQKSGGKKVRFTTLKHVGHNSWSAAYATPELFEWFNKHRRP
ncbi:MAG: prolyl oligopeptidase family serine peptidase [Verrucomicrobiaceae bacterium]|nr:prolyl oligopeptidase family serine peptidase [Verrucomicrobiaceae bacterium]